MNYRSIQVNNKRNSGFTLIELLVVIVIMTIMTGIGTGIFTGTNQKLQVEKAASSLLVMAQYARMTAIEQQRAYKIYLDMTNQEFYLVTTLFDEASGYAEEIIVQESLCAPVLLEGNIIIEDVRILSNDYNIENRSDDLYIITFAPDGTSQTAVAQIGDGQTHYTLTVNEVTGKSTLFPTTIENVKIDIYDIDAGY